MPEPAPLLSFIVCFNCLIKTKTWIFGMTSIPEGTHESCVLNVLYSIVTSENRGIFRVSQVRILFYLIIVSIQRLLNHLHYSIRHIGPIYRCSFWVYTVGKVLADLLVCDGWRYCKALCEKKFSQIERNRRKFSHMTYAITSLVKFFNSVYKLFDCAGQRCVQEWCLENDSTIGFVS